MKLLIIWMFGVPATVAAMLLVFFVAAPHVAAARVKAVQTQCSDTRTTCGRPSASSGTLVPAISRPSSSTRSI
jgi:hypothetical protein